MYTWELNKFSYKLYDTLQISEVLFVPDKIKENLIKGLSLILSYELEPDKQEVIIKDIDNVDIQESHIKISHKYKFLEVYIRYLFIGIIGNVLSIIFNIKYLLFDNHKNKDDIVLIMNSFGHLNRLTILPSIINQNNQTVYIYNNTSPKNVLNILKSKNSFLLLPSIPAITVFKSLLKISKNSSKIKFITNNVFSINGEKVLENKILDYFYNNIIHYYWAKKVLIKFKKRYTNIKYAIFDLDFGGKELFIINELQQNNIPTYTIQHGMMTDPIPYMPVADYMLCCSEREKNLLINKGIDEKRLFTYGVPLQVVDTLKSNNKNQQPQFDILIISTSGPIWYQKDIIKLINKILPVNGEISIGLRFHPAHSKSEKFLWKNSISKESVTITSGSLIDNIFNAKKVICTSIDPMVPLIFYSVPTIYIIKNNLGHYNFLKEFPNVNIISEEDDDLFLDNFFNKSTIEGVSNTNNTKFVEIIGEPKLEKIINNIRKILC